MKLVILVLILSILAIGQCRDLNHATGGKALSPEETARIEVCFEEETLGCFPETEPGVESSFGDKFKDWRINTFWRSSRKRVGTEFRFWAPGKTSAEIINLYNFHVHITEDSGYDPSLKAFFILHGFRGGNAPWALTMKDALMQKQPCNVFIVDWKGGDGFAYSTAAANTWLVGAELGRFIQRVGIKTGLTLGKVHLIGHSLGAHAAGFAGKWLKRKLGTVVARITGLDPAGPDFEGVVPAERLDKSDAAFVDIIHTNWAKDWTEGFGIIKPIGDFDFYPNGGEDQPGCPTAGQASGEIALEALEIISPAYMIGNLIAGDKDNIGDALESLACSHGRAIQFFIESINSNCGFIADECASWEDYQAGKCAEGGMRVPMGFRAEEFNDFKYLNYREKFYLKTNSRSPFCIA